jgi:hypothetical protein
VAGGLIIGPEVQRSVAGEVHQQGARGVDRPFRAFERGHELRLVDGGREQDDREVRGLEGIGHQHGVLGGPLQWAELAQSMAGHADDHGDVARLVQGGTEVLDMGSAVDSRLPGGEPQAGRVVGLGTAPCKRDGDRQPGDHLATSTVVRCTGSGQPRVVPTEVRNV